MGGKCPLNCWPSTAQALFLCFAASFLSLHEQVGEDLFTVYSLIIGRPLNL